MIDLSQVSLILITKEPQYPFEILSHIGQFPFGEILILTNCDSPYRKHELFAKAKYDILAYQDDDAICPWEQLKELSDPKMINLAITAHHFNAYKDKRMSMGLGWGSFFPKDILKTLEKYTNIYGKDELYMRDTEKILTQLNYPQNRFILPITNLPSSMDEDRLWRQPEHWTNMDLIEQRCESL